MNLLIVSGSQRTNSQSAKVADYLVGNCEDFGCVTHLELCKQKLVFWDGEDESLYTEQPAWHDISVRVDQADALVLITPEWGGMASPLIKNFLLMCEAPLMAHKPVLLVSVVSGLSGAYPIAELRMNAFKNNKSIPIPDHVIVRYVGDVLNSAVANDERDASVRKRIGYSLHMLKQYATAMMPVRAISEQHQLSTQYHYGM